MRTACFQTDKQGQKSEVRAESWDMIAKKWYYIAVFALVSECSSNIVCEDSSRTQFVGLQLTPARGLKHGHKLACLEDLGLQLTPARGLKRDGIRHFARKQLQLTPARGLKLKNALRVNLHNVATHTREGIAVSKKKNPVFTRRFFF